LEEDHEFDWENVAILNEELQYRKRLLSEIRKDTQSADKLRGTSQSLLSL